MSKLEKKSEMIKSEVIERFKSGIKDVDLICADLVSTGDVEIGPKEDQISFSELIPLVKFIGQQTGFIQTLAERKIKCSEAILGLDPELSWDWEQYEDTIKLMKNTYDLPVKYVTNKLNGFLSLNELRVPKKPTLKGWKLKMVECFRSDADITEEQLVKCLADTVKSPEHYVRDFYEFARALALIGLED